MDGSASVADASSDAGLEPTGDSATTMPPAPVDPCPGSTLNACGGCGPLEHAIGEVCSNGGTGPCALPGSYQCLGEKVVCNAPPSTPQPEVCDGMDNDCNGMTDEGLLNACKACGAVPMEICDGKDNDCDGMMDEGVVNACGGCGEVPVEVCDGKDNDCDGMMDEGFTLNACGGCGALTNAKDSACSAGSGGCAVSGSYVCTSKDAVACNAVAKTASAEVCDGADNDCDGMIDEEVADPTSWYQDCDGDGYGIVEGSVKSCAMPALPSGCKAWLSSMPAAGAIDCRDDAANYHPGMTNGSTFAVPGTGLWANELKYDFDCDGVVRVSDYLWTFGRYLPWCDICSATVTECAAGPKPTTAACGNTSSTSKFYKWVNGTTGCSSYVQNSSLLCQ